MQTTFASEREALAELIGRWYAYRPLSSPLTASFEPVAVPDELRGTITRVEPFHSRALTDGALYLALPYLTGFGLEFLPDPAEISPYQSWPASISPFHFRLSWTLHMDGREPQVSRESWQRVALEDGVWKIVSFWSPRGRRQVLEQIEQMQRYLANRCCAPWMNKT